MMITEENNQTRCKCGTCSCKIYLPKNTMGFVCALCKKGQHYFEDYPVTD